MPKVIVSLTEIADQAREDVITTKEAATKIAEMLKNDVMSHAPNDLNLKDHIKKLENYSDGDDLDEMLLDLESWGISNDISIEI